MDPRDALIIPAAGHADRFGKDKLTQPLLGRPLFAYALMALAPFFSPERRFIAVAPERIQEFQDRISQLPADCRATPIAGGDSRFQSVYRALCLLPEDTRVVLIHDAARPLVSPEAIGQCIQQAARHGAAVLAHPVTDTIKVAKPDGLTVSHTPDRSTLWAAETPQTAQYGLLLEAFKRCLKKGLTPTDDVQALEQLEVTTVLVHNHQPNPKVTFPADLLMAETILKRTLNTPNHP